MKPAKIALAALFLAYPFVIYFGLNHIGARALALIMIVLVCARWLAHRNDKTATPLIWALLVSLALIMIVSLLTLASNSSIPLRFYPVAMNATMLTIFGITLIYPPTMIERIARLRDNDLPSQAVRYTRLVTQVWCGFFVLNGSIALYTALLSDLAVWTLYNGMIAYVLMGLLFAGEFVVRRYTQRHHQTATTSQ